MKPIDSTPKHSWRELMDIVELNTTGNYTPSNGAVYPSNSFGDGLQVIAQMINLDVGLRVSTMDLGGSARTTWATSSRDSPTTNL